MIVVTAGSVVALFLDFLGDIALFQYINVPFPANFEAFMEFFSANIFPNLFENAYDESESVTSTNGKFEEYECSRVFLDNCGGGLDKEFLALVIIIVTSLLALVFKSCPKVHARICKIRDSYRWNGFLAIYIGDFQEFFVFTLLQFKESVKPVISLTIGILLVVSYFVWCLYITIALNRRKKAAKELKDSRRPSRSRLSTNEIPEQEGEEEIGDIPESMSMVIEEFERKNWYSRNFLLLMCLQNMIVGFILVFLQNWGTIQAGLYSYIAILYGILVLGAFRPFKEKSQAVTFFISHIVKGIMGCLALALGLDEKWMLFSEDQKNAVGIVLITLAGVGISGNLILLVGIIGKAIRDYCRKIRKKKTSKSKINSTTLGESPINRSNYVESHNNLIANLNALGSEASFHKKLVSRKRPSKNIIQIRQLRHNLSHQQQPQEQPQQQQQEQHLQQQQQQQQRINPDSHRQMEYDLQTTGKSPKHAPRRKNVIHILFNK